MNKLYESKNKMYSNQEKSKSREDELNDIEEKISEKLCEAQRKIVERELDEMNEAKKKGRCGAIFKLKAKVIGEKKEGAEAIAIKNPTNGNMVYDSDEIKTISLKYCQDLLKDKKPDDEFSFDVKVKEILHDVRMKEILEKDDHVEFTNEHFEEVMEKL